MMTVRRISLASTLTALSLALVSCSNPDASSPAGTTDSVTTDSTTDTSGLGGTSGTATDSVTPDGVVGTGGTDTGTGGETETGAGTGTSGSVTSTVETDTGSTGNTNTGTNETVPGASEDPTNSQTPSSSSDTESSTDGADNTGGESVDDDTTSSSTSSTADTDGTASNDEPEFHIYLALGQSNMQGAAHLPDEPISHPRVKVLQGQNCSEHDIRYGEWRDHFQPMIRCQEGTRQKPDGSMGPIGLSPADTFAVTMAEAAGPNVTIGIVGAAYGGTDIRAHLPDCGDACTPPYGDVIGAPIVNGTTPIYQWILDLAKKAQEVGVIKGIIFHHGESNSGDQAWLTHVNTYITSLRNDLGLDAAEVPFIAGELPRTGCCPGHNSLVQQIPDYVENGHWVSSGPMEDGTVLGDRSDSLHWSTFSVIEMGKRYAEKMLEVGGH